MRLQSRNLASLMAVGMVVAACGGSDSEDGAFGGGSSESSPAATSTSSAGSPTASASSAGGAGSTQAGTPSTSSGEGAGGEGTGGAGTCTDLGDACTQCEASACPETYCDCYEDSECLALSACIVACGGTADCYQGCATDHPTAISRGALLVDCAATDCPVECPGYQPLTTCQACLYTECQDEMNSCVANPDCTLLLYCIDACDDATCVNDCYFEYPDGTGDVGPVGDCLQDACPVECG